MSRFLEGKDNALFLVGVDLDEQIRALGGVPQRFVVKALELGARQDPLDR